MTFEEKFVQLLSPLVAGDCYWDVMPEGKRITAPLIILQTVGGKDGWYVDQSLPDHENARVQVMVWSPRRAMTNAVIRQVRAAIAGSDFIAEPYGAPVGSSQASLKLFGARQDYGIWYPST